MYRLGIAGKSAQEIIPPGERIYFYRFSPDRTRLAYVTGPYPDQDGRYTKYNINVMDLGTQKKITIAESVDPTFLQWSPDGSKVAFISYQELDSANIEWNKLYVVNSDGSHKVSVNGNVTAWNHWLLWTPDSQQILFSGGTPFRLLEIKGDRKITEPVDGSEDPYWASFYLVNSDGSGLKRVSPERKVRDFWSFDWIDAGHRVVANTNLCSFAGCSQNFVRIVDIDTGQIIQTDPNEKSKDNFALSPDLSHLVSWCQFFSCNISYQSIDGSENEVLGRGIYWDTFNGSNDLLTWSPDGSYFALVAYSDSQDWQKSTSALYIDDTRDKKPASRVTQWLYRFSGNVYGWHWSWSPDSRYLAYVTPGKGTLYLLDLSDLENATPQVLYENEEIKSIGPVYWQP